MVSLIKIKIKFKSLFQSKFFTLATMNVTKAILQTQVSSITVWAISREIV
jgi:hypothetical protein